MLFFSPQVTISRRAAMIGRLACGARINLNRSGFSTDISQTWTVSRSTQTPTTLAVAPGNLSNSFQRLGSSASIYFGFIIPSINFSSIVSSDRSLRLWDCVTGNCVRLMTGHKSAVHCLAFSPDGRFLASGSRYQQFYKQPYFFPPKSRSHFYFVFSDLRVLVWDIAYGHLLAELTHHTRYISSTLYDLS